MSSLVCGYYCDKPKWDGGKSTMEKQFVGVELPSTDTGFDELAKKFLREVKFYYANLREGNPGDIAEGCGLNSAMKLLTADFAADRGIKVVGLTNEDLELDKVSSPGKPSLVKQLYWSIRYSNQ